MTTPISTIEERLIRFMDDEVFRHTCSISAETDLVAAGFDSLSLVNLLLFIEKEYGVWIPQNDVTADMLRNVRSLAAAIAAHRHE